MVRLRREHEELVKTEPVTGWWIDIEANSVVVYVRDDVDGARLRLQDRYGPMITTEYGVATVC